MTIHLSGEREQRILSLVQTGRFSSPNDVIDEALRLVHERYPELETITDPPVPTEKASDRTAEQLENLKRLGRKLDAMPSAAVEDGLSNRDHDRILYGT
jgi:Arc/MetJ-type ribon-helix-helix transcriptional regulator